MKLGNFLRYVLLPAAMLAAGIKLGIKYAEDHYVVKDRKFIESEVRNSESGKREEHVKNS